VRAGGERRELLVAGLDEADLVADLVEAAEDAVDPVAGIPVDLLDAPLGEALEDEAADGRRGHVASCVAVVSRPALPV
jgi:hypothetical protein